MPNPILDPGFEFPGLGPGGSAYAPSGTPWTFAGGAGISANNSPWTSGNPSAPEGSQVGFLQNVSSVGQSFHLDAGGYVVSFLCAQRGNYGQRTQALAVYVDGALIDEFSPPGTGYTQYTSPPFTVAEGQHTLLIQGLSPLGGDVTAFIDAVVVGPPNPPPPPPPPSPPLPPPLTGPVVVASAAGILFDGGDQTAAVQAVLDTMGARGKPWCLLMDGVAVVGEIRLWPQTTVAGLAGGGFRRSGLVRTLTGPSPMVGNRTQTFQGAGSDDSITLRDLYLDGNSRGGGGGVGGGVRRPTLVSGTDPIRSTVGFFGCTNVVLENVRVYDSVHFGFQFGNCQGVRLVNCESFAEAGDPGNNNDCLHINGGCARITVIGFEGSAGDDCFALNADDVGFPCDGPISDVYAENLRFYAPDPSANTNPGRFLSSDPAHGIRDVTVRGFSAPSQGPGNFGWVFSNFNQALGSGAYANIVLESVRIDASIRPNAGLRIENAHVADLTLRGFVVDGAAPAVLIGGGATIGSLQLDGLSHRNAGAAVSIDATGGTLARLRAGCSDTARLLAGVVADVRTDGTEDS